MQTLEAHGNKVTHWRMNKEGVSGRELSSFHDNTWLNFHCISHLALIRVTVVQQSVTKVIANSLEVWTGSQPSCPAASRRRWPPSYNCLWYRSPSTSPLDLYPSIIEGRGGAEWVWSHTCWTPLSLLETDWSVSIKVDTFHRCGSF